MKIVIEGFRFTQELRAEDDVLDALLFPHGFGVPHRDSRLYNHEHIRIDLQCPFNRIFYSTRVKEVIHIVIVRRRGDDHKIR